MSKDELYNILESRNDKTSGDKVGELILSGPNVGYGYINDYQNTTDDINQIGLNNGIDVCQVISILMNHKIISKRTDARGYEIYKKSEEYQNKLKCNLKCNLKK